MVLLISEISFAYLSSPNRISPSSSIMHAIHSDEIGSGTRRRRGSEVRSRDKGGGGGDGGRGGIVEVD